MRKSGKSLKLLVSIAAVAAILAVLPGAFLSCSDKPSKTVPEKDTVSVMLFNADSAYAHIEAQCAFGPRVPNTEAHERCGQYIVSRFKALGLAVTEQKMELKAYNGTTLKCMNIFASTDTTAKRRILVSAHWDSRPWADNDPDENNHKTPVLAANDGASGVAVMLELARALMEDKPSVGVDFVCFDAEDYPGVVAKVWAAAEEAGYGSMFPKQPGGYVTDDHLSLIRIASIPAITVIPYYPNYAGSSFGPTWHTVNDTPANIDRNTLEAVGQTMLQLIYNE